jgi:ABC-type antimicrobial peptide transport system permease subunit
LAHHAYHRRVSFDPAAAAVASPDGHRCRQLVESSAKFRRDRPHHLLPNAIAPIVVQATLDIAGVIILESTLSFLGLGIQPPTASWGNMLSNAQATLETAWWAAVFPGLAILVTVLAINYIGDGLRDALDPNMR